MNPSAMSVIRNTAVRSLKRAAICLLAGLASACATHFAETPPAAGLKSERDAATLAQVRSLGGAGDWLVIRGYHATDNLVASLTNKPLSHAAVLDPEHDQVIEAEAQGIHASPLSEFVAKSHRLLLIRPVWADARTSLAAARRARELVGKQYDFLGLIGFNIPDRYYCSELTLEVYRPYIRREDIVPRPIEPGQLFYWGRILYDSGAL